MTPTTPTALTVRALAGWQAALDLIPADHPERLGMVLRYQTARGDHELTVWDDTGVAG